jgi:hypothetical protein
LDEIYDLVDHYHSKFGIQAIVLPVMKVDGEVLDSNRNRLIAEDLIKSMLHTYQNFSQDESAVTIGITFQDMYPRGENWQFCFGWRTPRFARRGCLYGTDEPSLSR